MAIARQDLSGVLPAFPTPTQGDGEINVPVLKSLIDYLIRGGVGGLVPVGGTGEFTALSPAARACAVETTVAAAAGRVPVVAGVLSPGLAEAVAAGQDLRRAGADAALLLVPFYVAPTQAGIIDYFRAYRDRVDLPIVLYDIPYRTRITVTPETIATLAREGTIIGMKACNPDIAHFERVLAYAGEHMAVLSGEDGLFPVEVAMGAPGGILATASIVPGHWVEMFRLARDGKLPAALQLHHKMFPLIDAVFAECNPGPLKQAMHLIGFDAGHVLLPLKPPAQAVMDQVRKALAELADKDLDARLEAA